MDGIAEGALVLDGKVEGTGTVTEAVGLLVCSELGNVDDWSVGIADGTKERSADGSALGSAVGS